MTNILKRLEVVEKEVGGKYVIPEKERLVIISYPDGDDQEFERLKAEKIEDLKKKYGPDVFEEDLLFIGVRKFCQRER